jgi:copper chaperone CopZ
MTRKIIMKISGMECPNCAMILERIEDKVDGVKMVEASYHKGEMKVEFDEVKISEGQIKAEVKRLGYEVVDIEIVTR